MKWPWNKWRKVKPERGYHQVTMSTAVCPMGSLFVIDGMEIHHIRAVSIDWEVADATQVTVTFLANVNVEE